VLDGHKYFITNASIADFFIVMAVTDPDEVPHRRATQIIVPARTPGLRIVREIGSVEDPRPQPGRSENHAELEFASCRLPAEAVLGGRGEGFAIAQSRLGPGRIHHCMRWVGICERAQDILCQHAATREIAPGKPLGHKQIVQQWIAESRAEIHAARLMVLHAAWKIETEGAYAAREEISLIKFTVARTLQRVLDRAVQALGGLGMTDDTPLAFWYAHERAARIYDGADEVHVEAVARRILRGYGMKGK
jgi:acyl-CoA dehydrogenase